MADDIRFHERLLRLSDWIDGDPNIDEDLWTIPKQALDEIERLRTVLDAIDDLHSPRIAHDTCVACDHDWPCPTQQLLHSEEARRG